MSTLIAIIIYGGFALGYVAMLALTERSAGRYVRNEIAAVPVRTVVVITSAGRTASRSTAPAYGRVSAPAA